MEDSVFIKTEDGIGKFCFWLSISSKRFRLEVDSEPVKSASAVPSA